MAQLALLICLAFIIVALVLDSKESRRVSQFLWIPTFWFAIGASKSVSYWIYPSSMSNRPVEIDYLAGSPLDRNIAIFLIFLGLVALWKRKKQFSIEFKSNFWIYVFYVYALMSVSWSNYTGVSIKRWIKLAADAVMALIILTEDDRGEAIEHVFRRCSIVLIPLSALFIRYYRWIGVYYDRTGGVISWRGASDQKNGLGLLCAYFGIFLIWRIVKKGWRKLSFIDLFLLLLALYLLLGSQSSTSAVVFVIGVFILGSEFYRKKQGSKFKNVTIVALLIISILQGLLLFIGDTSIVSLFFSAAGRESSFTGRVPLWKEMIKIGKQRPIFGAGYGGFWIGNRITHSFEDIFWFTPGNSHNGYIDLFVDLGLMGLIFLFLLIVKAFNNIALSYKEEKALGTLLFTFLIMVLFHNVTESSIAKATVFLWDLFLLSVIVVTYKQKVAHAPALPAGKEARIL